MYSLSAYAFSFLSPYFYELRHHSCIFDYILDSFFDLQKTEQNYCFLLRFKRVTRSHLSYLWTQYFGHEVSSIVIMFKDFSQCNAVFSGAYIILYF